MSINDEDYWGDPFNDDVDRAAQELVPMFRTLSLKDMENLPDPEWLVAGLLPTDSFTVMFGAPGSTKSFWALDVAMCVASGTPFNGSDVKQGKVVYFVGEGLRGLKLRIEAWRLAHPESDMDALYRNLIIIPEVPRLLEKGQAAAMLNTTLEIAETATDEEPLRMFILDTWARSLVGGDENSAQDTGVAIDVCERVRKKTGATALIVHHTGADGLRERGSTALRGAADTSLKLTHDKPSRTTELFIQKMKDGEEGRPIKYLLAQYGRSVVLMPTQVGTGMNSYNGPVSDPQARPVHGYRYLAQRDFRAEAMAAKESPF